MQIVDLAPLAPVHHEQAADILVRAFARTAPDSWNTIEEGREEVAEVIEPENICRAVLLDDRVVAWAGALSAYSHAWEVHPVAVDPDYQRRGIGRALMLDLEQQARERGALTLYLGSDDQIGQTSLAGVDLFSDLWQHIARIQNRDQHAFGFYQRLGYQIVGVIPDASGTGKPDIWMAKRISLQ